LTIRDSPDRANAGKESVTFVRALNFIESARVPPCAASTP
jgi:hypothetical protein